MTTKYTPREAQKLARKLGWVVEPKARTGDILFESPSGDRYTSRAPGRADRVPRRLAKALDAAKSARTDS